MSEDLDLLESICERAKKLGATFADARLCWSEGSNIQCQDGKADKVFSGSSFSGSVRVLFEGAWGFASTDGPDQRRLAGCLVSAIEQARAARGKLREPGVVAEFPPSRGESLPQVELDPRGVPLAEKLRRVAAYEKAARDKHGQLLVNTLVYYGDSWRREVIASTRGTAVITEQIRTRIGTMMVARSGQVRQSGHEHRSGLMGLELLDRVSPEELSIRAADRAVELLSARRAPSGPFPVVFHPSIAGLFTHEAIGHNVEADLVFSGMSILEGRLGTRVASEHVTIIDDATIPFANGSYAYDSEGTPSARRVIVEKGILKGYLHSLETAARFGATPQGSARADGAHALPIVRMSNTFIAPGEQSFEELLAPIGTGVFLSGGQWGYVFCERGQFVCNASEGWMIRNGKLAERLRDVSVSGMTLEALENIDGVSREFELAMPGTCGKSGQGAPITAGGPYVRVKELVVGGQEDATS